MSIQTPLTVTDLNRIIKSTLETTPFFERVSVFGELSNLTKASSGHWYFTLKDKTSRLSCVMFSSAVRHLNHPFKEGDQVEINGRITLYEASGTLQLNVNHMQLFGIGALYAQLEQLRLKLQKEGLFDQNRKRALPRFPQSIGLVTSIGSAAQADVLKTIRSRWPIASVTSYGSLVQGEGSVNELIQALQQADKANHDVIIIARGGGSIEDLWSFNHESLVRFIASMSTITVSGVGHESDTTLIDYVVDVRGPTPTGAATLVTPLLNEVISHFDQLELRLNQSIQQRYNHAFLRFQNLYSLLHRLSPQKWIEKRSFALESLRLKLNQLIQRPQLNYQLNLKQQKLEQTIHLYVERRHQLLKSLHQTLHHVDYFQPLQRGFAYVHSQDKQVVSISDVNVHDTITITLKDGSLETQINSKKENYYE
ncbi:MAG: exodeoxyribonuclease VII large subunit [Erysipelothrix sp.]|nr:exodeoxyribonuclease VII large subunit [Erysipelothrix sp.]